MLAVAWRNRAEAVAFVVRGDSCCSACLDARLHARADGRQSAGEIAWANLEYIATIALPLLWLQVVLIYTRGRGLSVARLVSVRRGGGLHPLRHLLQSRSPLSRHPDAGHKWRSLCPSPRLRPIWSLGWAPFVYGLVFVRHLRAGAGDGTRTALPGAAVTRPSCASLVPSPAAPSTRSVSRPSPTTTRHGDAQHLGVADGLCSLLVGPL